MANGKIGVTTENIFPVIKKFLYSDHEIFLRELVSNAVDATQKLRTLSSCGEVKGELGELEVRVTVDSKAGTLTVSDNGIGMSAEDVDRYINQIAFSGAEEFLSKYKENANSIIGHFGLGFYSAFMVSKKVEINSLSYKEGAEAVRWTCDGSPEYSMEKGDRSTRGTDIILYIDDDSKEFLEQARIDALLKKYCRFLPVRVVSGKEQEWKDGKMVDTDRDKVVNSIGAQWMKKPSELTDEDYRKFYHELYPGQDDPLFWIHLNVDYPFTLTGILYFPKIKNEFEVTKNRIQLYCNQVYVTDSVEGVVPDFMMLLQGVIDSPDIPLNVSRSYLQSDANVKKISSYITKKVSQRLEELFKNDRKNFEEKWNDIRIFIEYGMLTDEKFCDSAMKFALVEDTEHHFYTLDEYKTLIEPNQTDKDKTLVYLYTTDPIGQYNYIKAANDHGYSVLLLDGRLDSHFVSMLEQKNEHTHLVRVDSDVVDNLIRKEDEHKVELNDTQRTILTTLFSSQVPEVEKSTFVVSFSALTAADQPIVVTQNEYSRRMKDMAALQPGMAFFGEMPDSYNLVVNTGANIIKKITEVSTDALAATIKPFEETIASNNKQVSDIRANSKDGKLTPEEEQQCKDLEAAIAEARSKQEEAIKAYADSVPQVRQLIDIALLGNGLLKGKDLSAFIARSVELIKL